MKITIKDKFTAKYTKIDFYSVEIPMVNFLIKKLNDQDLKISIRIVSKVNEIFTNKV